MAFAQLSEITENVSKLHENANRFDFHNSSPQLMTVGYGFLLLLWIFVDIAAIVIAIFYLNKFIRTDQVPTLLKILRDESHINPVLPSWKPPEPKLHQESIDPTSCAELSSETYHPRDIAPLPNYVRISRRNNRGIFFSSINNQTSQVDQDSSKKTIFKPDSTNCCNVRTNDVLSSQLQTSRTSRASSTNCQDSSTRSSAYKYENHRNLYENSFLQQQRKQLWEKKNVPDAIKHWLTEFQEDDSMGFKTSNSRLSYTENSDFKKKGQESLQAGKNANLFHPDTNLNSTGKKCTYPFESKDPLEIERLDSHDKVRNYLCDLKPNRCASASQASSGKRTLRNNPVVRRSSEADLNGSERKETITDRFREFEFQSTNVGDTFSGRRVNLLQPRKTTPLNDLQEKELIRNLSQTQLNKYTDDARRMSCEAKSVENGVDYENFSMTDSQSLPGPLCHNAQSTSDLTTVSIETEVNINYKMHIKPPTTSMTRSRRNQKLDITEESDEAIATELKIEPRCEEPAPTCTETLSSEILRKRPLHQPVASLKASSDEISSDKSSSDSLSSESTLTDRGSPEKFASETNSLWHMMTKTTQ